MWSLGVLLYTLLFSENPFCDVEEILDAKLNIPFPLSSGMWLFCPVNCFNSSNVFSLCDNTFFIYVPDLQVVLSGLLQPDQSQRMTLDELLLQSWISQPISLADYSWSEVVSATHNYCECYSLTPLRMAETLNYFKGSDNLLYNLFTVHKQKSPLLYFCFGLLL